MSNTPKLIIVLGAHRSGTSLCAAAVQCLGADLGLDLHYSNEENRKGFFEHPEIVSFNDRLLSFLGGSWDNPLFDGSAALDGAELDAWQVEAAELVSRIFADVELAAVKDPRMCQLMEFWLPVFESCGFPAADIVFLHTLRDPVEVAVSQQRRASGNWAFYEIGRNPQEGAALWLSLTAQALAQTSGYRNYFLSYHRLLDQPQTELEQLAAYLQLHPGREVMEDFCQHFVDQSLHRSTGDAPVRAALAAELPQIFEFDAILEPLGIDHACDEASLKRLLGIFERPDTRHAIYRAVTPVLSRLSDGRREDRLLVEKNAGLIDKLTQQAAELGTSYERSQTEHEAVVEPLRAQVGQLEDGNRELQSQLAEQAAEMTRAVEEHSSITRALSERAGQAEERAAKAQEEGRRLENERAHLDRVLQQMYASTSWRITRPLRALSQFRQALREQTARSWMKFKLRSIRAYHRMELRAPTLAWILRRVLRPLFRSVNWLLLGQASTSPIMRDQSEASRPTMPMAYQQIASLQEYSPLVTVIVPNYNHARFLRQRLESIFSQSYRHFEVILLDDCSQDDSHAILEEFHHRYPEKSQLVLNEENSGGVFYQWEKGLQLARGEIIWIAESDDWCSQNFLATLVPYFRNEAIQLAYAKTIFMSGSGKEQIWTINEYLQDIDAQRWHQPIVDTAHRIVASAFAIKNIIPNVSSALFRNPGELELLQDPQWKTMRTCGDWLLYLHLLRGGMLAYSPEAHNYYRIHDSNTSVEAYSDDSFYIEHEIIARAVQHYYRVDPAVLERQRELLVTHWQENRADYSEVAFEACYSPERIREAAVERAPNLLMVGYAFCAGGGETFPVQLANLMKGRGYNVTYLDCAQEPRIEAVRDNLRSDIPVVSNFSDLETIVHDFGVDVIHSHHAWVDNVILDLLPEDTPCQTVVTLHGMYETINNHDLKRLLPRLVERSIRLVYTAEKNLESLHSHGLLQDAPLVRIDNALEVFDFEPVPRADLGIAEDAFLLTLVSRAIPDKGWAEAVAAVTLARESSGRDIHLILIGEGPEYDLLQKNSPPPYIHLEGFRDNIRSYFAASQLGFLPTRFRGESFPLVVIDCLHAGRPVLASAIGEIASMLETPAGPAGCLFELEDWEIPVQGLAAHIARLAVEPDCLDDLAGRVPAAARKFDPAVLCEKYDRVYRGVPLDDEREEGRFV